MALPQEVEFFAGNGSEVGSDDDAVEFGPRQVPRWAIVLACAVIAAAFVGAIVTRSHPAPAARAAPTGADAAPGTVVADVGRVGASVPLGPGPADALDVLIYRHTLYVLRPGGISVVELATYHVDFVPLTGRYSSAQARVRLLLDPGAGRLWVLAMHAEAVQVVEFNVSRMLLIRHLTLPLAVRDVAAMSAHLYLATPAGLADLAPRAQRAPLLPDVHGAVGAVAADPTRDRILALDVSAPYAVVVAITGRLAVRRSFGNLIKGSLAVVGDAIWMGGYGSGAEGGYRAILTRLDPATLAPVRTSGVAQQVDRVFVSAGGSDVWVSASAPGLWCFDARTGNTLQHWLTASAPVVSERGYGPVTSLVGSAYAIDHGSVVPLVLQGCAG